MSLLQECRVCHAHKPVADFHKDKTSQTGYRNKCARCRHISEQLREGLRLLNTVLNAVPLLFPDPKKGEMNYAAHIKVSELKKIFKEHQHDSRG